MQKLCTCGDATNGEIPDHNAMVRMPVSVSHTETSLFPFEQTINPLSNLGCVYRRFIGEAAGWCSEDIAILNRRSHVTITPSWLPVVTELCSALTQKVFTIPKKPFTSGKHSRNSNRNQRSHHNEDHFEASIRNLVSSDPSQRWPP